MLDYHNALKEYKILLEKTDKRREKCLAFHAFLKDETNWLEAPASSRFHLPVKGGLLVHSVGVCKNLLRLKELFAPTLPDESCIICGLFHDVGKAGMPGIPLYLKKDMSDVNEENSFPYQINPLLSYSGIAMRSAYLLGRFIPLAQEELQAVLYHDGLYIPEGQAIAHKEEALTLLLHWADYWTAHIEEDKWPIRITPYKNKESTQT